MWQRCVVLSGIIAGCLSASLTLKVSRVVSVPRGGDAVLGCSFTHARQQHYPGTITVRWLAREGNAEPFFSCSVRNDSSEGLDGCSAPGFRFSLKGDPRRGGASLLIRRVQLDDNGTYFCRVELEGWWSKSQKQTELYVMAAPQILNLSVVETSSGSDSAPQRLQCEAEGHPLPTITWRSASSSTEVGRVQSAQVGRYRLVSSVPYLKEDVLTCRAESRLGGAEQRFPASNTLMITVTACGLVALLLLLLSAGLTCCRRNTAAVCGNSATARDDASPVDGNADVVEIHRLQRCDSPAEGDAELQLLYSTVTLTTSSQYTSFNSYKQHLETGVVYSPVNVQ